ncbi:MAG: hypothetical protein LBJ13_00870 [Puniceicoccales bacterium]|jgi:hypothetical protein|nr:hypothetical protein [Puniceicoccales bacterium]
MLENILTKNGRALLGIAFSFLLSNASLEAVRACVHWTSGEDQILEEGVKRYGTSNWTAVATLVPDRTPDQCRQRWYGTLDPAINKRQWSKEEDQILMDTYLRVGRRWAVIAARLPGRTDHQCRSQYIFLTAAHQQRVAARLPAPPVPMVDPAGVAVGGNRAAVAGAADPANPPPVRPPAPPVPMVDPAGVPAGGYGYGDWDLALDEIDFAFPISPIEGVPVGDGYGYGDPAAVANVAGLAPLSARLLAAPLPASRPALPVPIFVQTRVPADKTMLTDAIFDHEDCEFFEKLRGVPVGDGYRAAATGAVGFANPLSDLASALNDEEFDPWSIQDYGF